MNEQKAECVVLTISGSTFPRMLIRQIFPCKFVCHSTTRKVSATRKVIQLGKNYFKFRHFDRYENSTDVI